MERWRRLRRHVWKQAENERSRGEEKQVSSRPEGSDEGKSKEGTERKIDASRKDLPTNVEHPPSVSRHSRRPSSSKHESFFLDDLMRDLPESSFGRRVRDETRLSDLDELILGVGREVDSFHS